MAAVAEAPSTRRIKELEVMVADVVVETPDTSTLVFFTGNDHLEYKAGRRLRSWHFKVGSRGRERKRGVAAAPFLETVLTDLLSLGVPNSRIKRESYG